MNPFIIQIQLAIITGKAAMPTATQSPYRFHAADHKREISQAHQHAVPKHQVHTHHKQVQIKQPRSGF